VLLSEQNQFQRTGILPPEVEEFGDFHISHFFQQGLCFHILAFAVQRKDMFKMQFPIAQYVSLVANYCFIPYGSRILKLQIRLKGYL
jgi:hypothetical protein